MEEIWKDVKGYEGIYQISNLGNVKSLKYNRETILNPSVSKNGYYNCILYKNKKRKTCRVHQLVAIAFLNHKPDGYKIVVDHIDNNPLNNNVNNLQLITTRENTSKDRKGVSKYLGVYWNKQKQKWRAQIRIKGVSKHLGYFINEYEAHLSYQNELAKLEK